MKLIQSIAVLSCLAFAGAAYAQNPAEPVAGAAGAVGGAANAVGGAVGGAAGAVGGAASGAANAATGAVSGATGAAGNAMKPRSAKSLDCSKQADSQKLHGKARKHFMSDCKTH